MTTRIEVIVDPGEEECLAILRPFRAHNLSQAGDPKPQPSMNDMVSLSLGVSMISLQNIGVCFYRSG